MRDVKNPCICASPLTFWTLLFAPAVTVAPRCTLLEWKHPPHESLRFHPSAALPAQYEISTETLQSFWHKHKCQRASILTTQGAYLDHWALEPMNKCCPFMSPGGGTIWGCITHGSSEVPSSTETPDTLSRGEFSKTPQLSLAPCSTLCSTPPPISGIIYQNKLPASKCLRFWFGGDLG